MQEIKEKNEGKERRENWAKLVVLLNLGVSVRGLFFFPEPFVRNVNTSGRLPLLIFIEQNADTSSL